MSSSILMILCIPTTTRWSMPSLDQRRHEEPRLINHLFAERGMPKRVDAFGTGPMTHLAKRDWPQKLQKLGQLLEAAKRLASVLRHKNVTEVAAATDPAIPRWALGSDLDRLFGS